MEKERGLWKYLGAGEVLQSGKSLRREIEDDPSRSLFDKIVEGDSAEAYYRAKAWLIAIGRTTLVIPFLRLIQKGLRSRQKTAQRLPK